MNAIAASIRTRRQQPHRKMTRYCLIKCEPAYAGGHARLYQGALETDSTENIKKFEEQTSQHQRRSPSEAGPVSGLTAAHSVYRLAMLQAKLKQNDKLPPFEFQAS